MMTSDNTTPHKAAEYDKSVRQTIPFYETIQSQVVDLVRTLKPEAGCWLDTGCGTGYLIEIALPHFPLTNFILVDPSESMLNEAINRYIGMDGNRVRFLPPAASENLTVYQDQINPQVITAVLSHHYLKQSVRRQATETCYKLLDEDGLLITVENIAPDTQRGVSIGLGRWKRFQLEQGRTKPVIEEHIKRYNTEYFPISIDEHFKLLKDSGFRIANLFWMSYMQAGFYAIK